MPQESQRFYWLGNAAKSRAINEILTSHFACKPVTVFDYGCGDGGDWPAILEDHLWLKLVGYEPNVLALEKARERLKNSQAVLLGGNDIDALTLQADYIISFSVFEHVVDREAYLRQAKRLLAPHGLFILNYDDGHFRYWLDLARPRTWLPALRSWIRTGMSRPMAALGMTSRYQARVAASAINTLIASAGFRLVAVEYHNLTCLKELAKTIPEHLRQDYTRWWIDVEKDLNQRFRHPADLAPNDSTNLWSHMGSCTLHLQHM
ncbi:MAG: class I SAM-dependent methyltransferase [Nitrospira sp.]|nr:class I SAM-dependent methyltransferase [Nitrospira sp.]